YSGNFLPFSSKNAPKHFERGIRTALYGLHPLARFERLLLSDSASFPCNSPNLAVYSYQHDAKSSVPKNSAGDPQTNKAILGPSNSIRWTDSIVAIAMRADNRPTQPSEWLLL